MSVIARHNPILGVLWMAVAAVFFSVTLALVRHLSGTFTVFEIAVFRLAFGLMIMLPWFIRVGPAGLRTNNFWFYCGRAVFAYIGVLVGYYSVVLITIADSVALQFTLPIFTAIFAMLILKERVRTHRWVGVLFGFTGALIIVRPGFAEVNVGMLLALAAALIYAGIDVSTRFLTGKDSVNLILFYGFALQLPIAAVPAAMTWVTPQMGDLPWIAAFVVAAVGAHICITKSFSVAEASLVSPVLYLRLPLVALIGFVFFQELPGIWTWVGGAILFGSTYYSARRDNAIDRAEAAIKA